jgi:hypothetical protein
MGVFVALNFDLAKAYLLARSRPGIWQRLRRMLIEEA